MVEMKKVLFVGIDNAGKSSILHVLKKNYSFLNKLKPTKGIERSKSKILEIDFVLWDMGGQEQYLTQYFERKEFIFSELSLLFFIIDIQEEIRFDKALSYFEKIINVLREYEQFPTIIIFYHKTDPDIKYTKNVKLFTNDLTKKIRKIAPNFNMAFFPTSIFERWSIVAAFSFGIRALSEETVRMLSDYLESWAGFFGANAVILLSSNDVIIGEYSSDESSEKMANQYLNELEKLYGVSKKPVIVRMDGDLLTLAPFKVGKMELFLVKYTNNPEISEEYFTRDFEIENQDELENLLLNFFQKV